MYLIQVGTKMKWEKSLGFFCFNDCDYAGDPITRISVIGFVLYVLGVPVSWQSKAQRNMTLAQWVTLSEAAKEVIFVVKLLWSMNISWSAH